MRSLRKGGVRIDGVRVRSGGFRVETGQEIIVPWEAAPPPDRPRTARSVPILWRGENVLVVDKPARLLVQPDVKDGDSVITRVWGMVGSTRETTGFAPAAVHRLDRNTTGVLAVALDGEALRELLRLFRERAVSKRYLAVVVGVPVARGVIDAPLLKTDDGVVRVDKNGRSAETRYERISTARVDGFDLSLVEMELLTGRTHQARVHMAHIGHPVLGDGKYADMGRSKDGIEANRRLKSARPLLHALSLGFPEGLTGPLLEVSGRTFRSPPPEEFSIYMAYIR
jgi:23S rRNA pseudouridine955/2504/2580 synthase